MRRIEKEIKISRIRIETVIITYINYYKIKTNSKKFIARAPRMCVVLVCIKLKMHIIFYLYSL